MSTPALPAPNVTTDWGDDLNAAIEGGRGIKAWNAANAYQPGEVVNYRGQLFRASTAISANVVPGSDGTTEVKASYTAVAQAGTTSLVLDRYDAQLFVPTVSYLLTAVAIQRCGAAAVAGTQTLPVWVLPDGQHPSMHPPHGTISVTTTGAPTVRFDFSPAATLSPAVHLVAGTRYRVWVGAGTLLGGSGSTVYTWVGYGNPTSTVASGLMASGVIGSGLNSRTTVGPLGAADVTHATLTGSSANATPLGIQLTGRVSAWQAVTDAAPIDQHVHPGQFAGLIHGHTTLATDTTHASGITAGTLITFSDELERRATIQTVIASGSGAFSQAFTSGMTAGKVGLPYTYRLSTPDAARACTLTGVQGAGLIGTSTAGGGFNVLIIPMPDPPGGQVVSVRPF